MTDDGYSFTLKALLQTAAAKASGGKNSTYAHGKGGFDFSKSGKKPKAITGNGSLAIADVATATQYSDYWDDGNDCPFTKREAGAQAKLQFSISNKSVRLYAKSIFASEGETEWGHRYLDISSSVDITLKADLTGVIKNTSTERAVYIVEGEAQASVTSSHRKFLELFLISPYLDSESKPGGWSKAVTKPNTQESYRVALNPSEQAEIPVGSLELSMGDPWQLAGTPPAPKAKTMTSELSLSLKTRVHKKMPKMPNYF
jgi:hypothetical protein